MSNKKHYDLCVIGAGPGGYVAAIRGAQLGLKVAVIEANHLGGICLNWGCIPTKALLRTSEINHLMHNLDDFGFSAQNIKFDFNKIIQRSRKVASRLSSGIAHLLKKNKVDVIDGFGKLIDQNTISISKDGKEIEKVTADDIILATGARARKLPNIEVDEKLIWTYKTAMTPKELRKELIIIGSGAIGIEFASFYHNMGAKVTVIEMADNIVPSEDEEISKTAQKILTKQGLNILTKAALQNIKKLKNSVEAEVEVKGKIQKITADRAILAIGIVPNVENIGLEDLKIDQEKGGFVKTNQYLQTNIDNIHAIGDICLGPWLAHKASHEGVIAAEFIASKKGKYNAKKIHGIKRENIPGCTYSNPQIASVGLTEKQAKEQGLRIKVGRFPYQANGKAIAMGETDGLIKTIFDANTGELLGAHLIGAEVTEMIQVFVLGKTAELVEEDFIHTIFAHPTLSEMLHESVLDAFDQVIHF